MSEAEDKTQDVVTIIGREIAAMHGALLALTSVIARHGDANAIVGHLMTIREGAAREANSSQFVDILDKMIDVAKPPPMH